MKIINVDNIYAWAILVSSISQVIITGWTFSQCFKIRISKVLFTALMILVSCIAIVPPTFFQIYFPIKAAILFILVFVVFKLSSESDFVKPFIFLCLDMLVNITLEMLLMMTVTFIGINDFQDVNDVYTFNRMISSLMFTVICIPFKYLIALLWNRIVNKSTSSRLNLSLILFPAAQTFAMVGMVADHAGNADAKQHPMVQANSTLVLTISFLTFLVADIVYLYFMADLEKKAVLEREVSSLKYARQLEEQHFKQIEEKRYEVAKIRHDINNQLASIKSMVHSRHIEQAEELIGELENTVRNTQEYRYCSIPVVNAVISEKNKEAEKYGIRLVTKIDIPDSCGITQHHLCSAFANMIDNAIRAERGFTEKDSDKKIINVDAVSDSVSVYITVRNYVSGVEISREDDSSLHGYGQQILGDIAQIYSGRFEKSEKNGEYTCTLILGKKAYSEEKI
ncbi:MAG: GHKL domain-containing protein [[Eubacterium] siraeum]|nr:GHKL domain-containing protein [[Eubacterium] siraeum]